jgi:hypothetical protein
MSRNTRTTTSPRRPWRRASEPWEEDPDPDEDYDPEFEQIEHERQRLMDEADRLREMPGRWEGHILVPLPQGGSGYAWLRVQSSRPTIDAVTYQDITESVCAAVGRVVIQNAATSQAAANLAAS